MNPFFAALEEGYSPEEVIKYISKAIPKMAPAISKATRAGYGVKEIIGFLSKNFDPENRKGMSESERHAANYRSDAERTKYGLKMAATAVAAPIAAGAARNALARVLPSSLQVGSSGSPAPTPPSIPPIPNNNAPPSPPTQGVPQAQTPQINAPQQPPINPPAQSPTAQSITQTPNIKPSEVNNIDAEKYLKDKGVLEQVKTMLPRNTPEEIAAVVSGISKSGKKSKGIDPEMLGAIEQYAQTTQQQPEISAPMEHPSEELDAGEQEVERQPIAKNSIVATPQGVGEVKEIRNGQAIVEVDGKRHKVKESEIEPPLISEDETADLYDELFANIPEEHRSGYISWAGYDEDLNKLGFIPRGGKYEELENITPEEAKLIKEGKGVARTTGERTEGLWVVGEDTRGGIISQIVHDRRKEMEPAKESLTDMKKRQGIDFDLLEQEKQDKGMKPIFDELSYPRGLSEERKKKARLEERTKAKAEKQRLKDEEKARKKRKK